MGVINNLIEIRRMFRAIVGANWDGTKIDEIVKERPIIKFTKQPVNTDAQTVNIGINVVGFIYRLERRVSGETWELLYTNYNATVPSSNISVPLTTITQTSEARIVILAGTAKPVYSDVFTVTRTAAQTASLKAGSASKGNDIFTESEVDSIGVVKENIEKE